MSKEQQPLSAEEIVKLNFPNPAIIWADEGGKKFKHLLVNVVSDYASQQISIAVSEKDKQLQEANKEIERLREALKKITQERKLNEIENPRFIFNRCWHIAHNALNTTGKPGE